MKKLLGLLLVAAIAFPANAAVIKNVELTGEVQTIASTAHRTVDYSGWDDYAYNKGAWTRAMAGLSFDLVEDVKANLLFQYAYAWGDNNYLNNGFEDAKGMKLANANLVFSNLFGALEATIGRQFYGEEDSAVMYFGPNHYNAEGGYYANALDAVKLVYSNDSWTGTVIAGKVANWRLYNDDYPVSMYGADVKANVTDALTAQAYVYGFKGDAGYLYYGDDDHQGFYGVKVNFAPESFRASVEYARDMAGDRFFREHKDTGYMVKADAAVDVEAFTVRGTFLYSKNFVNAYGNYVPGLLMQPFFTQNRWTAENVYNYTEDDGVRLFNIGFDYKPAEQWTLAFDAYSFQNRFGRHTATYEFDLTAKYDYNEYVQLFAGVGYAKYGSEYTWWSGPYDEMFGPDNTKGQIGMLVRF